MTDIPDPATCWASPDGRHGFEGELWGDHERRDRGWCPDCGAVATRRGWLAPTGEPDD